MRYRPTSAHTLVLRAALAPVDEACAAYVAWRTNDRQPDVEERRLLPLIASNIAAALPDDELLRATLGERRRTLASHVRRVASCVKIADELNARAIATVWFKGIGMLPWYTDPSVRPMTDADLLIPWLRRHDAIDLFASLGFRPLYRRGFDEIHALTAEYPGWGMQLDGTDIDVHWRPLHLLRHRPAVDDELFALAGARHFASGTLVVPDPSHHLVLILAHGMRASSEARPSSLVDAIQLLRAPQFNPAAAAHLARAFERASALRAGCAAIAELRLAADVDDQIAELQQLLRRRTIADRLVARAASSPAGRAATRARLVSDLWRALATPLGNGGPVAGVLGVTRARLGVRRIRDIPGQLLWLGSGRSRALEWLRADRGTPAGRRPLIGIGHSIDVATIESLSNLLPVGWWEAEGHFVWSRGREAVIDLEIDLGAADACHVALQLSPFVGDARRPLEVEVRVNHQRRARWRYTVGTPVSYTERLTVTRAMLAHRRCQIMLLFTNASSPRASIGADDDRVLGVSLVSVAVEPV